MRYVIKKDKLKDDKSVVYFSGVGNDYTANALSARKYRKYSICRFLTIWMLRKIHPDETFSFSKILFLSANLTGQIGVK